MAKAKRPTKKVIDEVVEQATEDVVNEFETELGFGEDADELDGPSFNLSNDVFEEGFKRCTDWKDSPRYHIKKNSQLVGFKDYPYSWEHLFKDYGPGVYHVTCKGRASGRIAKQQTEIIGDPNEGREVPEVPEEKNPDSNLAVLGWLQQSQERAEARAREMSRTQESSLATVMQAVMTSQQQSQQTMMQMMMEQSKQTQTLLMTVMQAGNQKGPDPVVTLLTTLLTKEKPKDGMGFAEVMKLLQDKERDTRSAVEKQYEMIEKKADQLAEVKAAAYAGENDEPEESLSKTILKAFMPVLPQIMAGGQQQQPGFQAQGNPALNQGFVENPDGSPKKMIGATGNPRPAPAPRETQQVTPRPVAQPEPVVSSAGPVQNPVPPTKGHGATSGREQSGGAATSPKDPGLNARQKDEIFNFVASDLASAMVQGVPASTAAEVILKKLENEGIPRQTIAIGFKLEDFHGYADKFIPSESLAAAKDWLKEFHEAIQKIARPAPPPIPVGASVRPNGSHGTNGSSEPKTVAAKRSGPARGTGTQPRTPAKNI